MADCQVSSTTLSILYFYASKASAHLSDHVCAAIIDPNNDDITLFESGAIVSYLIATYDKSSALTYTSSPERFQLQQWSYFQASGQGPYFGQAAWYVSISIKTLSKPPS